MVPTVAIAATRQIDIVAADKDCIVIEVNKAGKVAESSMEGGFDAFEANIDCIMVASNTAVAVAAEGTNFIISAGNFAIVVSYLATLAWKDVQSTSGPYLTPSSPYRTYCNKTDRAGKKLARRSSQCTSSHFQLTATFCESP